MNYFYTTQIFLRYSSNCGAEPMTVRDNFSLPPFLPGLCSRISAGISQLFKTRPRSIISVISVITSVLVAMFQSSRRN